MRIRRHLISGVSLALVTAVAPAALTISSAQAAPSKFDPEPVDAAPVSTSVKRGPSVTLGDGGTETYLIALDSPAVPTRASAKRPAGTKVPSASAYRKSIRQEQTDLQASIRKITKKPLRVLFTYTNAVNGFAVKLTRNQAAQVAKLPGLAAVKVDEERELHTDRGPEWIGAPSIWDGSSIPDSVGSVGVDGTKGEGIVVGVIDTGINPLNPSFAATVPAAQGGDDYVVTNPRGHYYGVCDPSGADFDPTWPCNDKLIGFYDYLPNSTWGGPGPHFDYEGHGTHTASTAAGNQVDATAYAAEGTANEFSVTRNIKGVAPHANIIAYAACCTTSGLTAAIDQAIADEVDVINYSIGASAPTPDPWTDFDAVGFLNARAAGINVAVSAGNDGPGDATVGSPADVPWVTSVGATTHDRQWQAHVENISADGANTLPDINGVGFSKATAGTFPLVDAGDLGNELCLAGGFTNPGDVAGKIVVCLRGTTGRVEKGQVVADLGGAGMVLANNAASGASINADAHALPAAHITYADGVTLRTWLDTAVNPVASLSGGVEHIGDDVADIMAAFSSRGPNGGLSIMSPSVTAPGVDILAAGGIDGDVDWEFMSGTSMASPHTAGAMALLEAAQPDWTPAELQSALMTTAEKNINDDDGTTPAGWFDMGSGRVDLNEAAQAGLVLNETYADYVASAPGDGGDVRTLNLASMEDDQCLATCAWTRSLTGTSTGVGDWGVSVTSDSGDLTITPDATTVTLSDGASADLTITADVAPGTPTDTWLFGEVVLTPPIGSDAPEAHLPVAVLPTNGVLPTSIDIETRRDVGSQVTDGFETIAAPDLQVSAAGLAPGTVDQLTLVQDPTNGDAFDGLTPADGVDITNITVPADAERLVARLANSTAPDLDLYVGTGAINALNVVCASATGTANESCDIASPAAGDWWVLVQDWEAGTEPTDTVDLTTAVVSGNEGNLTVTGPAAVLASDPYSLTTEFDEASWSPGETWFGAVTLGTSAGSPSDIGVVAINVTRMDDDVTVTPDVTDAEPGDVITYTVSIAPNVTPADLDYDITAPIPAGTTYVDSSATGGATYNGGSDAVEFTTTMPTLVGDPGSYSFTTSDGDPTCVNPFEGDALYTNLADFAIGPNPAFDGDTAPVSALNSMNFRFYNKVTSGLVITDDGFINMGGDGAGYAGEPWTPQSLPDAAFPNGLFAPLWQDGEFFYDAGTGSGVSLATAGDMAIVEYDNFRSWGDAAGAGGVLDMEFIAIEGNPNAWFVYGDMDAGDGSLFDGVTIGAEGPDGDAGSALVNVGDAATVLHPNLVVCANYAGPSGDPVEFTYQVQVSSDPAAIDDGPLVNLVTSATSDPVAVPVDATSTVTISGVVEDSAVALSLDPADIAAGASSTATAVVTTTTGPGTPTGDVEFLVDGAIAGMGTLDGTGTASADLAGVAPGTHSVVAHYLGSASNSEATSEAATLTVADKVASTTKIKAKGQVKIGSKPKVQVVVKAAGASPTGTVTLKVKQGKKVKFYTATLTNGKAIFKLAKIRSTKTIRIKATYPGDDAVAGSIGKKTIKVKRKKK